MTRDLSVFTEDNAMWRDRRKRVPWDERMDLIKREFPSVVDANWHDILQDGDVLARLLKDILKVDQIEPGRAGPRPNLDRDRGMQSWKELTGQDYSERPFAEAFRVLTRNHSLTAIARKTGISRSRVDRLLHGQDKPTVEDIRSVARSYGKKPAYFSEYRLEFILAAVAARLDEEYELTVSIYSRLNTT